jgi:hypothetical protein
MCPAHSSNTPRALPHTTHTHSAHDSHTPITCPSYAPHTLLYTFLHTLITCPAHTSLVKMEPISEWDGSDLVGVFLRNEVSDHKPRYAHISAFSWMDDAAHVFMKERSAVPKKVHVQKRSKTDSSSTQNIQINHQIKSNKGSAISIVTCITTHFQAAHWIRCVRQRRCFFRLTLVLSQVSCKIMMTHTGTVMTVQSTELLPSVFQKLCVEGFLSAPVCVGSELVGQVITALCVVTPLHLFHVTVFPSTNYVSLSFVSRSRSWIWLSTSMGISRNIIRALRPYYTPPAYFTSFTLASQALLRRHGGGVAGMVIV